MVLGPILLNIFIGHLDDVPKHILCKFVDDTKLGGIISDMTGGFAASQDLHRLKKWANRSLMKFNNGSDKSCPWGGIIPCTKYMLWVEMSSAEKAPGVLVDTKVNMCP